MLSMEGKASAALGVYRWWWWRSRRTALHCGHRTLSWLCMCANLCRLRNDPPRNKRDDDTALGKCGRGPTAEFQRAHYITYTNTGLLTPIFPRRPTPGNCSTQCHTQQHLKLVLLPRITGEPTDCGNDRYVDF